MKLKNCPMPLPKPDEQEQILRFIADATSRLDAMIGRIEDGVRHLKEFRTALISAAVTGKIDVRERAA